MTRSARYLLLILVALIAVWLARDLNSVPGRAIRSLFVSYPRLQLPVDFAEIATVEKLKTQYPSVAFNCGAESQQPKLGDYVCWSDVDAVNDINGAMVAAFFFSGGALAQIRVSFAGYRHEQILSKLRSTYGSPIPTGRPDIHGRRILMWKAPRGTVAASESVWWLRESVVLFSTAHAFEAAGIRIE